MAKIALSMIVKDEAHVIARCLDSVRPLIDFVLIEDTGSTDGTQAVIRDWLARAELPGKVVDEPWRDFAYNRSHALSLLDQHVDIDYALIMDADEQIECEKGFDPAAFKDGLTVDLVDVAIRRHGITYYRPQLLRNRRGFKYRGVLHEFIEVPDGARGRMTAEGFFIVSGSEGARSQDPQKYLKDAQLLERALSSESDPFLTSRYTFYLANSYRDCGDKDKALPLYFKRAEQGFWIEEVYVSLLNAARLQEQLGRPVDEIIATYLRAAATVPTRAEALYGASRLCSRNGRSSEGYEIAKRGLSLAQPVGGLFVEDWVYSYGLLDEFAANAVASGHYRDCLDACVKALAKPDCPPDFRARFAANAARSLEKLPRDPQLGSNGNDGFVSQHSVPTPRQLRTRLSEFPRVLIAVLAKQKEPCLRLYLDCLEALDYPKSRIVLYVRTNNNTDNTEGILREWLGRVGSQYAHVDFDASDVVTRVEEFASHEWNPTRFRVLGEIRNNSLAKAAEHECDFYFTSDTDNFIRPFTLRELISLNLPIVAPFLRHIDPGRFYSNYHAEIDSQGYYAPCDQYFWILCRFIRGVFEVPVVHMTYLIRGDVMGDLSYTDNTDRYEYVIFSDTARKCHATQYLDNRQIYGYITFDKGNDMYVEGGIEAARALLDLKRL